MAIGFPTKANWAAGDVLTASAQDDLAGTVNLLSNASAATGTTLISNAAGTSFAWQSAYNGNAVINGGMDIWQRGTSSTTTSNDYVADRWQKYVAGISGRTYSRQSSGLTGIQYGFRMARDSGNTNTSGLSLFYNFESSDSYRFAGQAVTFSFYAKAGANYSSASSALGVQLAYGTGTDQNLISGYTGQTNTILSSATLTTTYQRFSFTGTVNAAATQLGIQFYWTPVGTAGANDWCEITGVQVEFGSVATTFKRSNGSGGTLQGELAACQRYYWRTTAGTSFGPVTNTGIGQSGTVVYTFVKYPVTMRVSPTGIDYANLQISDITNNTVITGTFNLDNQNNEFGSLNYTHGSSVFTQYRPYYIRGNSNAAGYLGFNAEL
jgi:hypothetical protein